MPPFGHPQTCVYPDVCLGIAHVSGKIPLPGQGEKGRYTMYLPFSPYRFLGAKGADTLRICQTPCPGRGALPDTWAIPKHTSGQTQVWGCPTLCVLKIFSTMCSRNNFFFPVLRFFVFGLQSTQAPQTQRRKWPHIMRK